MTVGIKEPKNDIQVRFGKNVRLLRLALLLTQEKLAEFSGLHFTYVSSVERGERNISLISMDKLAKGMKCSLKDLMPY